MTSTQQSMVDAIGIVNDRQLPVAMKHIDFAAMRRQKSPLATRKTNTIPSQQRVINEDANAKGMMDMEQHSLAVQMDTQRIQLISPPPEEILSLKWASGSRSNTNSTPSTSATSTQAGIASKRKRAPPTPAKPSTSAMEDKASQMTETTPNPKPRKQRHVLPGVESPTRQSSGSHNTRPSQEVEKLLTTPTKSKKKVIVRSPHAKNSDADYIPTLVLSADGGEELNKAPSASIKRILLSARGSRRSATPIPPYEPPPDIFTPPREVFLNPAPTRSAPKRKSSIGRQTKARTDLRVNTNVQVKQEIPDDIDLLAPMPPPSPSDDPLLLSGPPEPELMIELQDGEASPTPAEERSRSTSVQIEKEELPPSSPVPLDTDDIEAAKQFDDYHQQDQGEDLSTEDSLMQLDPRDASVEPVRLFDNVVDDSWSDSDDVPNQENEEEEGEGEFTGKWTMMKVRTKQDPPSSATRLRQERWGRPVSPYPKITELELVGEEGEEEEEEEVRRLSIEPEDEEPPNKESSIEEADFGEDIPAAEDSQDDSSSDTTEEPSLVKITSADPRAAARAVAILKQHDYDCYTKLTMRRRASHSGVVDLVKESRRKDVSNAGIVKAARRRRRSTMGVIGDKVIIPGSPVTTLPDLLQRAEDEILQSSVRAASIVGERPSRDPFKTPMSTKFLNKERGSLSTIPKRYDRRLLSTVQYHAGLREWTKDDWKLLDACFTDQRIDLGEPHDVLAPVDTVGLADVVDEFINVMGGQSLVDTFGETWSRDNLLERTKALLKKQRSGSVRGGLPPTLLAPRYSHLLEEARTETHVEQASQNPSPCSVDQDPSPHPPNIVPATHSFGDRFRGLFASYLPILSRQPRTTKKTRLQEQPGLPLPPPSVLEKARGPIATPVRPSHPRAPHPKDIVQLNHVTLPLSNIPRAKPAPKRLVELVSVPQTVIKPETTSRDGVGPRPRRSSGSSVKDLVRGFEQMERSTDQRFAGGIGNTRNLRQGKSNLRPIWKP